MSDRKEIANTSSRKNDVVRPFMKATTLYFNFHPKPDKKFKGKNIYIYTLYGLSKNRQTCAFEDNRTIVFVKYYTKLS